MRFAVKVEARPNTSVRNRTHFESACYGTQRYAIATPTAICDRCLRGSLTLHARREQWLCASCRLETPYSQFEIAGRRKKVQAAVPVLRRAGLTPEEFSRMTEASWSLLAAEIGVKGFSVECRAAIAEALNDAA